MALADCQESVTDSRVKFEENGRKVVFLNLANEEFLKTRVDGCLKDCSPACDWVATRPGKGDVLLELKGSNVAHALKQLLSTAQYWTQKGYGTGRLSALVVCSQFPKVSTGIQRAQATFQKKFKAPLHVTPRNQELEFESLLEFGKR
jgi:hypothetical protein